MNILRELLEIKDFLDKAKRAKYMTVSKFMLTLRDHDYQDLLSSVRAGETLEVGAKRWADEHAPDITIIDDDDGSSNDSKPFKVVVDEVKSEKTAELGYLAAHEGKFS